jgi:methyl-accepting chemotaxis protein
VDCSATAATLAVQAQAATGATDSNAASVTTVASAAEELAASIAEELAASIAEIGRQVAHSSSIARTAVGETEEANRTIALLTGAATKAG